MWLWKYNPFFFPKFLTLCFLTCIHAVSIDFSRWLLQEREPELFSSGWWTGDSVFAGRGVTLWGKVLTLRNVKELEVTAGLRKECKLCKKKKGFLKGHFQKIDWSGMCTLPFGSRKKMYCDGKELLEFLCWMLVCVSVSSKQRRENFVIFYFCFLLSFFFYTCPFIFCIYTSSTDINPYPTAFPYGNGMVLHFYQQQEGSTTKTVHKVINKGLKTYV